MGVIYRSIIRMSTQLVRKLVPSTVGMTEGSNTGSEGLFHLMVVCQPVLEVTTRLRGSCVADLLTFVTNYKGSSLRALCA